MSMKKIIAALFLFAACATDPEVTVFDCSGWVVCDGRSLGGVAGKTCSDAANAEDDYITFSKAWVAYRGVQCGTLTIEEVMCADTAVPCPTVEDAAFVRTVARFDELGPAAEALLAE